VWNEFRLGFWHPFGPYVGRSVDSILDWKTAEIERYGWTFWSFVYSDLNPWIDVLRESSGSLYALCSHSPSAVDPDKSASERWATEYKFSGEDAWQPMPDQKIMNVTNPFKRRGLAAGFKVKNIILVRPPIVPPFNTQWYSKADKNWRDDRLPTRGEFLIRRGGVQPARRVSVILEIVPPYLALLKCS
jgi:hypothetical protein